LPSSTSATRTKPKRTRHNQFQQSNISHERSSLSEPLLSSSVNNEKSNSIELGTIDSDGDDDSNQHKTRTRDILRVRHTKPNTTPVAHGGGSIVIVEKPVRPHETLQAFAIRYRVPVCI
jgi:hypothetical protein